MKEDSVINPPALIQHAPHPSTTTHTDEKQMAIVKQHVLCVTKRTPASTPSLWDNLNFIEVTGRSEDLKYELIILLLCNFLWKTIDQTNCE